MINAIKPFEERSFHSIVLCCALALHLVTAWFSSGYYAADEHYQIIAFAQFKLGELSNAQLPWEFEAGIRSALLPSLAYSMISISRWLITSDPFCIAFILRLITGLFALFVVRAFVKAVMHLVSPTMSQPFVLLSYFLWFLPYQHVRFATETWAGLLFLLGLSHVISERSGSLRWLVAGVCFGLAIQIKPAMGIPCASMLLWVLMNNKMSRSIAARSVIGLLIAFAFGALVDRWFYGGFTPTTWNFIRTALTGDPQHTFEVYPWYYYLPWIIKYGIAPIGILMLSALAWLTFRRPRSLLVWCVWPYLIVLSFVPHKELRFLFPLVDLAPLLVILAWQEFIALPSTSKLQRPWIMRTSVAGLAVIVLLNLAGVIIAGTTAAGSGRTQLANALPHGRSATPKTLGYALSGEDIWGVRIPTFYLDTVVQDIGTLNPCTSDSQEQLSLPTFLIGSEVGEQASGCTLEGQGYRVIARNEPAWIRYAWQCYNSDRPPAFLLYQYDPAPSRPSQP